MIKRLNCETITTEAQLYKQQLAQYKENFKVKDLPRKFEGRDYIGGQNVEVQLPSDRAEFSLSFTGEVIKDFKCATNCDGPPRLKKIRIDSVYLTIAIPTPLDTGIFDCKAVQEFLRKYEIQSVCIDEECVYKVRVCIQRIFSHHNAGISGFFCSVG